MSALCTNVRRTTALLFTLTFAAACPADDGDDTAADSSGDTSSADTSGTSPTTTTPTTTSPTTTSPTTTDADSSTAAATESGSESSEGTTADDAAESSEGSTTAADGIEVAGTWTDDFEGTHQISDTSWVSSYGADSFPYTLDSYDNDADLAIGQSDDDATWARFEWTFTDEGELYVCQIAFGLDTAEEAENAPHADATDPEVGGCGGFPWSRLTPA